jgi:hypothetical protein
LARFHCEHDQDTHRKSTQEMQQGSHIPLVKDTLVSYKSIDNYTPLKTFSRLNSMSISCRNRNENCAEVRLDILCSRRVRGKTLGQSKGPHNFLYSMPHIWLFKVISSRRDRSYNNTFTLSTIIQMQISFKGVNIVIIEIAVFKLISPAMHLLEGSSSHRQKITRT